MTTHAFIVYTNLTLIDASSLQGINGLNDNTQTQEGGLSLTDVFQPSNHTIPGISASFSPVQILFSFASLSCLVCIAIQDLHADCEVTAFPIHW